MSALAVAGWRRTRLDNAWRWLGEAVDAGGKAMKLRTVEDQTLELAWRAD
jgi:hypothetical protein